jgi:hypothetical protein
MVPTLTCGLLRENVAIFTPYIKLVYFARDAVFRPERFMMIYITENSRRAALRFYCSGFFGLVQGLYIFDNYWYYRGIMTRSGDIPAASQREQLAFPVIGNIGDFALGKSVHGRWEAERPADEIIPAFYKILQERQLEVQPVRVILPGTTIRPKEVIQSVGFTVPLPDGTEQQRYMGPLQIPDEFGDSLFYLSDYTTMGIHGGFSVIADDSFNEKIRDLYDSIERELSLNSIYHGKSIRVSRPTSISFIDAAGDTNRDKIVYTERTAKELDRYLFGVIKNNPKSSLTGDENLGRSLLLGGGYGTGKTSAAGAAAELCEQNGWTFIQSAVGHDIRVMEAALDVAKLHQPAVVYIEDLDAMASEVEEGSNEDSVILNMLDGLGSKSCDNIIMIATTNFPNGIPAGWLRPGRFDKLIQFGKFDPKTFRELFRVACNPDRLGKINYRRLYRKTGGLPPAFLRQLIDDAMLMTDGKLSTEDFLASAESIRQHVELAARDDDLDKKRDPYGVLTKILDRLVGEMAERHYGR